MKTRIKKYLFLVIAMVMVVTVAVTARLSAAEPTTGSLTIICHEQKNGDTTNNPLLKGIEYTLYKVDETCEDVAGAESYVTSNSVAGTTKVTDDNGKVVYSNLALGRYYAKVTNVKEGTYNYESFIVDIPMTNVAGSGYDYDITVEPKIKTAYGNLELTKNDNDGNPLSGVKFKVQAYKYLAYSLSSIEDLPIDNWVDYVPEGSTEVLTVTTDTNGKIKLNNLPCYIYDYSSSVGYNIFFRLIEVSNPNDKYIIDNNSLSCFCFYVDEYGVVKTNYNNSIGPFDKLTYHEVERMKDLVEGANLTTVTYINEKPTISKKIKNNSGEFVDSAGKNITDKLTYKIEFSIPNPYWNSLPQLKDELPEGLVVDQSSIKIVGERYDEDGSLYTEDGYFESITIENNTIIFEPEWEWILESDIEKFIITYDATLDKNKTIIGSNGNINKATITYVNNIAEDGSEISTTTISDTAEVHTGAINIAKVEKGNTTNKLAGAKFKVATTKDNAKAGVFVKDENNADIEVTTDSNGQAQIKGLAYADDGSDVSYWLVETEAPKYKEEVDGVEVEKSYNLLKNPVEVKVGKTTHSTPVQVENSKGLNLPITGGIGIALFVLAGAGIMTYAVVMNKKQKVSE